jgi:hypothetical protein
MNLTAMLTFHAGIEVLVCLLALPLAWGWIPVNDFYGYRLGDYRAWSADKWYRVHRVMGRRLAWGTGVLAVIYGLLAWWGPVVPRSQFAGAVVGMIVPLVIVVVLAYRASRREAQRP